jgi:hypothetical protein
VTVLFHFFVFLFERVGKEVKMLKLLGDDGLLLLELIVLFVERLHQWQQLLRVHSYDIPIVMLAGLLITLIVSHQTVHYVSCQNVQFS